jgi:hypothetical protein
VLTIYLDNLPPQSCSHTSPFVTTTSSGFTVLFSYKYGKYIDLIYLPSPSPFTLPTLTSTNPITEPVLHLILHFLWDWGLNLSFGYFADGVLQTICPGQPQNTILQISASKAARIIRVRHQFMALSLIF